MSYFNSVDFSEGVERAYCNADSLQIKIALALGADFKKIQPIAQKCLDNPQHKKNVGIVISELHRWVKKLSKGTSWVPSALKETFRSYSPPSAERALQFFLTAGGDVQQINNFLSQARLPKDLFKRALFLDIWRRTIALEESLKCECSKTTEDFYHQLAKEGEKLLHIACREGLRELATQIIARGVDPLAVEASTGRAPLHAAALLGDVSMLQWLISLGADVNVRALETIHPELGTKTGLETPLHMAAYNGHLPAVQFLLKKRAAVNAASAIGSTALDYACEKGHIEVIAFLLENGAQVNWQNNLERTPLHVAYRNGRLDIAKLLLKYGADPSISDRFGETPFQAAVKSDKKWAEQLLEPVVEFEKLKADPALVFSQRDPLQAVFLMGDIQLARQLVQGMSSKTYKAELAKLQGEYPNNPLKLLIDAPLQVKKSLVYRVSREPLVPPVPPLDLKRFLTLFNDAEFYTSPKLAGELYIDETGKIFNREDEILHVKELSKAEPASAAQLIMRWQNSFIPIKIFTDSDGQMKIEISLDLLFLLYDRINFWHPEDPGYRDLMAITLSSIVAEAAHEGRAMPVINEGLHRFVRNIRFNIPFIGTPPAHLPEVLKSWYAELERKALHVIRIAIEEDIKAKELGEWDPTPSAPSVITLAIAGNLCGAPFEVDTSFLYETKTGAVRTFKEKVLHEIHKLKLGILEKMVDKSHPHNIHRWNRIQQIVEEEGGIPEGEKKKRPYFSDPVIPSELNKSQILERFGAQFTPTAIIDIFENSFNTKSLPFNEEEVFQWFKDNVPEEWHKKRYDHVHKRVKELSSATEKAEYLKSKGIVINPQDLKEPPKINWHKEIEQSRKADYIASHVFTPSGKYQRVAIIKMLKSFGALS